MIWKSEKADYVIYDQYGWQLPGHLVSPVSGTKDEVLQMYRFLKDCNPGHSLAVLPRDDFITRFSERMGGVIGGGVKTHPTNPL